MCTRIHTQNVRNERTDGRVNNRVLADNLNYRHLNDPWCPPHTHTSRCTQTYSPRPLENSIWPDSNDDSSGRRNESSLSGIAEVIFDPRNPPLLAGDISLPLPVFTPRRIGFTRNVIEQENGKKRRKHASACLVGR